MWAQHSCDNFISTQALQQHVTNNRLTIDPVSFSHVRLRISMKLHQLIHTQMNCAEYRQQFLEIIRIKSIQQTTPHLSSSQPSPLGNSPNKSEHNKSIAQSSTAKMRPPLKMKRLTQPKAYDTHKNSQTTAISKCQSSSNSNRSTQDQNSHTMACHSDHKIPQNDLTMQVGCVPAKSSRLLSHAYWMLHAQMVQMKQGTYVMQMLQLILQSKVPLKSALQGVLYHRINTYPPTIQAQLMKMMSANVPLMNKVYLLPVHPQTNPRMSY